MWLYTLKTEPGAVPVPVVLDEPQPPQAVGEWTLVCEAYDLDHVDEILERIDPLRQMPR
jgi:hypothetical protein